MPGSTKPPDLFDAVVVGGGLAGLAAARRLVLGGCRVALVERNPRVGGHLLPFERGRRVFEVGVHYIADTGHGSLWQRAWSELQAEPPQCDALDDPFERIVAENGSLLRGWSGAQGYRRTFEEQMEQVRCLAPNHAAAVQKLRLDYELIWRVASSLPFPVTRTSSACHLMGLVIKETRVAARFARLAGMTAQHYFAEHLGLPSAVCEYLLLHHVLIGCSPENMDALRYLLVQRYYLAGACTVRGGGNAVIRALHDPAVHVFDDCAVLDVRDDIPCRVASNERLFSLRLQKGMSGGGWRVLHTKNLIWTPDPRQLVRVCSFGLPLVLRLQLAMARNPHALVVGYFGVDGNLANCGLAHANFWLHGSMGASESYEASDLLNLAKRATVFVSPSGLGNRADVVRDNQGVVQAMFLVPPTTTLWGGGSPSTYRLSQASGGYRRSYLEQKRVVLEVLRERLEAALPGLRGRLSWQELGTPLTHHRFLHSDSLGGYGLASTRSDLFLTRPSYRTGRHGLYLAGAHTLPSHGLLTSLLSGVGAGRTVVASEKRHVPGCQDAH